MPGGAWSSPVITVAPVVVRPDMDSKKASVKLGVMPDQRNGSAPAVTSASQTTTVISIAWRVDSVRDMPRVAAKKLIPTSVVAAEEPAKTCQSGLPAAASTRAGTSMVAPSVVRRMPVTRMTGLRSRTALN